MSGPIKSVCGFVNPSKLFQSWDRRFRRCRDAWGSFVSFIFILIHCVNSMQESEEICVCQIVPLLEAGLLAVRMYRWKVCLFLMAVLTNAKYSTSSCPKSVNTVVLVTQARTTRSSWSHKSSVGLDGWRAIPSSPLPNSRHRLCSESCSSLWAVHLASRLGIYT